MIKKLMTATSIVALLLLSSVSAAQNIPSPDLPEIDQLKELHLETDLVRDGRVQAVVVIPGNRYARDAQVIADVVERRGGRSVAIDGDDAWSSHVPLEQHLIVLGNRSTNRFLEEFYNRHYTLLDLKYPGPGGHVVRTVHNPFGDGRNVILVGASDDAGVARAARKLADAIENLPQQDGRVTLGWHWDIQLSEDYTVPDHISDVNHWGESPGYEGRNTFGWNSINKNMALYHMTADEKYAREVIRLAIDPDKKAQRQMSEWDGDAFRNNADPFGQVYHYYHHYTILFWDLIEESPVFSVEEKINLTRALAREMKHRVEEGVYQNTERTPNPGGRHPQYAALCLYVLSKYFNTYYPSPIWKQGERSARLQFEALHETAWLDPTESENTFWYSTYYPPSMWYMLFSGDRVPMQNGNFPKLLDAQEMLVTGREPGIALNSASLLQLNQIAYLTGENHWLQYRDRLHLPTDVFRIGQSFWPAENEPTPPDHLVGKWNINWTPQRAYDDAIEKTIPAEQSFLWGSYRSTTDAGGDFILLDGHDGQSRHFHHAFALGEVRIDGEAILRDRSDSRQSTLNQVRTFADAMVEPQVMKSSALENVDVLGEMATATAFVPGLGYSDWRRTLAQRIGRYAVVADEVRWTRDSEQALMQTYWQGPRIQWSDSAQVIEVFDDGGERSGQVHTCDVQTEVRTDGETAITNWRGDVEKGSRLRQFALLTPKDNKADEQTECLRLSDSSAFLRLPAPAVAVAGNYMGISGDFVILAADHLFALGFDSIDGLEALPGPAEPAADVYWDFTQGKLIVNSGGKKKEYDRRPSDAFRTWLSRLLEISAVEARRTRNRQLAAAVPLAPPAEKLAPRWSLQFDQPITDLLIASYAGSPAIYSAYGKNMTIVTASGQRVRTMQAGDEIARIHYWPEAAETVGTPLIITGDMNEEVIAWTPDGQRFWQRRMELHPDITATNVERWFPSRHPGARGLYSTKFIDDQEKLFVGYAAGIELLTPSGELVERLPVVWGIAQRFTPVAGSEGEKMLLISKEPSDDMGLMRLSERELSTDDFSYWATPPGHTFVRNWARNLSRHAFIADMDGDGDQDVVSDITGYFNRVSIWEMDGTPLYNAQFGPGDRVPDQKIRDLLVMDVEGDGRQDVLVATRDGYLVVLDHTLEPKWTRLFDSNPEQIVAGPHQGSGRRLIIGCSDGSVFVLDHEGNVRRRSRLKGRVNEASRMDVDGTAFAVLATDEGEVAAFSFE